jgi:hypothetical protein
VRIEADDVRQGAETWADRARSRIRITPRAVPAVRALRTGLRTLHLIAIAALYGGHVYGASPADLVPALGATVATGGLFMLLEIYRAPIWLLQVRGVATLIKLGLIVCIALAWDLRIPILTAAIAIGAVSSHMPGRWRYYSLLHGRVVGPRDQG